MKIVINICYGGFRISEDFFNEYYIPYKPHSTRNFSRTDSRLIEYIEKYGSKKASGFCAKLEVVEIPDGSYYRITEEDGCEDVEILDLDHLEKQGWRIASGEANHE